ncbi:unnamed protein product [Danaus chrysippus]|uniref:(African queen) hypothetical protein n=1 Tax=Danaus chrysippus TaxID=151541 RepID=A0A8J2QT76_9NEOP|nr:unnamed protein product [Danaus chrysippus]
MALHKHSAKCQSVVSEADVASIVASFFASAEKKIIKNRIRIPALNCTPANERDVCGSERSECSREDSRRPVKNMAYMLIGGLGNLPE